MKYRDLIESIKSGREIEFSYNNINYSITNYDGVWYFSEENDNIKKSKELSNFEDYAKLVRKIGKINIEGKTIKYLFDNEEYDQNSLYIL